MNQLKLGRYKHFKGKEYEVIAIARDSETLEEMVVYRALYESAEFGEGAVFVRPAKMFLEHVERDGYSGPRFKFIE